jgi:hypothetical protein
MHKNLTWAPKPKKVPKRNRPPSAPTGRILFNDCEPENYSKFQARLNASTTSLNTALDQYKHQALAKLQSAFNNVKMLLNKANYAKAAMRQKYSKRDPEVTYGELNKGRIEYPCAEYMENLYPNVCIHRGTAKAPPLHPQDETYGELNRGNFIEYPDETRPNFRAEQSPAFPYSDKTYGAHNRGCYVDSSSESSDNELDVQNQGKSGKNINSNEDIERTRKLYLEERIRTYQRAIEKLKEVEFKKQCEAAKRKIELIKRLGERNSDTTKKVRENFKKELYNLIKKHGDLPELVDSNDAVLKIIFKERLKRYLELVRMYTSLI